MISLPGMRELCVRIGSAGKIFSLTGWKVGWVTGPKALVEVVGKAHQFITFTTSPALQLGVAYGLERQMDFTLGLTRELQGKRDVLRKHRAARFQTVGVRRHVLSHRRHRRADERARSRLLRRLVRDAGVALIPLSVFYKDGQPQNLVRFAFCKKREVIAEAIARLEKHFGTKKASS